MIYIIVAGVAVALTAIAHLLYSYAVAFASILMKNEYKGKPLEDKDKEVFFVALVCFYETIGSARNISLILLALAIIYHIL